MEALIIDLLSSTGIVGSMVAFIHYSTNRRLKRVEDKVEEHNKFNARLAVVEDRLQRAKVVQ